MLQGHQTKGPYRKSRGPGGGDVDLEKKQRDRTGRPRIRCPRCGWQPDGKPYWQCELCFTTFDTFKTRAHCPKCPNHWEFTQCIQCGIQSRHDDWYVEEPDA